MSKTKSTRSTAAAEAAEIASKPTSAPALRKVFFITEALLEQSNELKLEHFFHPGKAAKSLFITHSTAKQIYELIEFAEPRRSWLINSDVCSNGRIYMTTPIDVNFLVLHYIRKHCKQKALSLDSIHDEQDETSERLLTNFVNENDLKCIADVKQSGGTNYYKYNHEYAMAWLAVKTRKIAEVLRTAEVHCGHTALSANYARSEKSKEELINDMDYLRMACDIVGEYIALDLHDELIKYLEIPSEIQALTDEKNAVQKRKSLKALNGTDSKKFKTDGAEDSLTTKLKDSGLLDTSVEETQSPETKPTPLKERTLTAKEKALAKGAKGTKSIASFFKK